MNNLFSFFSLERDHETVFLHKLTTEIQLLSTASNHVNDL